MWAIVAIIVILAAFVLWNAISPELPRGLRLPKPAPRVEQAYVASVPIPIAVSASRWTVLKDGTNWRLSREFLSPVRGEQMLFYPPVLHLSCYGGLLYAWVDTQLTPQEDLKHPGTVAVQVNDRGVEQWKRGEHTVLVAPRPRQLLQAMLEAPQLTLSFAFDKAAQQPLTLTTGGIGELTSAVSACGGPIGTH